MIKILSQEIKECEDTKWNKTIVLEIYYKIKKDTWRFLLKDYNATTKKQHNGYIKEIKEQIAKQYLELKK